MFINLNISDFCDSKPSAWCSLLGWAGTKRTARSHGRGERSGGGGGSSGDGKHTLLPLLT
eukprot:6197161-Pleurochrysis_carterae.AAC.1